MPSQTSPPSARTRKDMGSVLLDLQWVGSTEQTTLGLPVRISSPGCSANTCVRARSPGSMLVDNSDDVDDVVVVVMSPTPQAGTTISWPMPPMVAVHAGRCIEAVGGRSRVRVGGREGADRGGLPETETNDGELKHHEAELDAKERSRRHSSAHAPGSEAKKNFFGRSRGKKLSGKGENEGKYEETASRIVPR